MKKLKDATWQLYRTNFQPDEQEVNSSERKAQNVGSEDMLDITVKEIEYAVKERKQADQLVLY